MDNGRRPRWIIASKFKVSAVTHADDWVSMHSAGWWCWCVRPISTNWAFILQTIHRYCCKPAASLHDQSVPCSYWYNFTRITHCHTHTHRVKIVLGTWQWFWFISVCVLQFALKKQHRGSCGYFSWVQLNHKPYETFLESC